MEIFFQLMQKSFLTLYLFKNFRFEVYCLIQPGKFKMFDICCLIHTGFILYSYLFRQ